MRTEFFDYDLPPDLIATRPLAERSGGRLCVVDEHELHHKSVTSFVEEVGPGDLLVLNETRVRQARLIAQRPTTAEGGGGARVELLFLHPLGPGSWAALGKANRPLRPGDQLEAAGLAIVVRERGAEGTLILDVNGDLEATLLAHGTMPIPPYMDRQGDQGDVERYQTVFARALGSAAAPTAGLHFSEAMLEEMQARGVRIARVVLHVGLGTFRPVSVEDLDAHPMHSEEIEVGEETAEAIAETRRRGGRVVAIGTTVVRALESARDPARPGHVLATSRSTNLLIQPGYAFSVVDALWTNFHQPKSTLLALVAAFTGFTRMRQAYSEAISLRYRFLSYGDAMWIPRFWADSPVRHHDRGADGSWINTPPFE